jgi:hypothetical protein
MQLSKHFMIFARLFANVNISLYSIGLSTILIFPETKHQKCSLQIPVDIFSMSMPYTCLDNTAIMHRYNANVWL